MTRIETSNRRKGDNSLEVRRMGLAGLWSTVSTCQLGIVPIDNNKKEVYKSHDK